jgi:hypothetical protein
MKTKVILVCCFTFLAAPADADTLIHAGRLIDGVSARPLSNVTIRIDGDTIVAVERGLTAPGCGFNLSLQHLSSNYRAEDVENEAASEAIYFRFRNGLDLGSMEERRDPQRDCA